MGSAGHDAHGVAHPRPHPRGDRPEPRRPTRRSPLISRALPRRATGRVGPGVPVGWSVWRLRSARAPPDSRRPGAAVKNIRAQELRSGEGLNGQPIASLRWPVPDSGRSARLSRAELAPSPAIFFRVGHRLGRGHVRHHGAGDSRWISAVYTALGFQAAAGFRRIRPGHRDPGTLDRSCPRSRNDLRGTDWPGRLRRGETSHATRIARLAGVVTIVVMVAQRAGQATMTEHFAAAILTWGLVALLASGESRPILVIAGALLMTGALIRLHLAYTVAAVIVGAGLRPGGGTARRRI